MAIAPTDTDGIDETFNDTLSSIVVGTVELTGCPMTHLYVNDSNSRATDWNETLLTINDTETVIFTSVIPPLDP